MSTNNTRKPTDLWRDVTIRGVKHWKKSRTLCWKNQEKNQKNQLKSKRKNQKSKKNRTPFFQVLYPSGPFKMLRGPSFPFLTFYFLSSTELTFAFAVCKQHIFSITKNVQNFFLSLRKILRIFISTGRSQSATWCFPWEKWKHLKVSLQYRDINDFFVSKENTYPTAWFSDVGLGHFSFSGSAAVRSHFWSAT